MRSHLRIGRGEKEGTAFWMYTRAEINQFSVGHRHRAWRLWIVMFEAVCAVGYRKEKMEKTMGPEIDGHKDIRSTSFQSTETSKKTTTHTADWKERKKIRDRVEDFLSSSSRTHSICIWQRLPFTTETKRKVRQTTLRPTKKGRNSPIFFPHL